LTEVEVDEVLGLVGDVGAEVTADDAVPSGVVLLVELLLDVGGDVLLDVELLHGLGGDFGGVGLHVFGHVSVLDDGFTISGHFVEEFCFFGFLNDREKTLFSDVLYQPLQFAHERLFFVANI
jgi:hypothetical protein